MSVNVNSPLVLGEGQTGKLFDGGGLTYKRLFTSDSPVITLKGTDNILANYWTDDSNISGVNGAVVLTGDGNIIRRCGLMNCVRYGFTVSWATNFQIVDGWVDQAQYGVSGASGGGVANWSRHGLIARMSIKNIGNYALKLKSFDDVMVRDNILDISPFASMPANMPPANSRVGIDFTEKDAPCTNVTVENNTIFKNTPANTTNPYGHGILAALDDPPSLVPSPPSSGNIIRHNNITNCYRSIWIKTATIGYRVYYDPREIHSCSNQPQSSYAGNTLTVEPSVDLSYLSTPEGITAEIEGWAAPSGSKRIIARGASVTVKVPKTITT